MNTKYKYVNKTNYNSDIVVNFTGSAKGADYGAVSGGRLKIETLYNNGHIQEKLLKIKDTYFSGGYCVYNTSETNNYIITGDYINSGYIYKHDVFTGIMSSQVPSLIDMDNSNTFRISAKTINSINSNVFNLAGQTGDSFVYLKEYVGGGARNMVAQPSIGNFGKGNITNYENKGFAFWAGTNTAALPYDGSYLLALRKISSCDILGKNINTASGYGVCFYNFLMNSGIEPNSLGFLYNTGDYNIAFQNFESIKNEENGTQLIFSPNNNWQGVDYSLLSGIDYYSNSLIGLNKYIYCNISGKNESGVPYIIFKKEKQRTTVSNWELAGKKILKLNNGKYLIFYKSYAASGCMEFKLCIFNPFLNLEEVSIGWNNASGSLHWDVILMKTVDRIIVLYSHWMSNSYYPGECTSVFRDVRLKVYDYNLNEVNNITTTEVFNSMAISEDEKYLYVTHWRGSNNYGWHPGEFRINGGTPYKHLFLFRLNLPDFTLDESFIPPDGTISHEYSFELLKIEDIASDGDLIIAYRPNSSGPQYGEWGGASVFPYKNMRQGRSQPQIMKLSHIDGKIDYNFYGSHYYYTLGNGLSFPKNLKMEGSIKVGLNGNETLKHFGFMNQDGRFF